MPAIRRRPKAYFTEHAVADRFAPAMRRVVLEAIQGSRRRLSLDSFTARWSQGPEAIFNALPWRQLELDWFDGWRAALLPTVQAAMRAQLMNLRIEKASEPVSQLGFSLDLTNPRAIRWAEEHAAELVVQLSEETKANLRRTIADMYIKGVSPREAMRVIQRQLGLSARDGRALDGLRHRLEVENAKRIVENRKPLPVDRLDGEIDRYANRLLRHRAEVVVRTESIRASAEGQQELWTQAREQGYLQPADTRRAWLITPDERLCEICAPLAAHNRLVGLEEPFLAGDGSLVMTPPAHPQCRCSIGLVFSDAEGNFRHPQA